MESLFSISDMEATLGKSIGAVWTMNEIAKRVGVAKAFGKGPQARLALLLQRDLEKSITELNITPE